MFKKDLAEYKIPEIEKVINQKVRMKVMDQYENIGKVPGVQLDAIKRAKILKDLKVKSVDEEMKKEVGDDEDKAGDQQK